MRQEISFLGIFVPMLFVFAVTAGVQWFLVDTLMLRLRAWRYFYHPPLARLALYVVLLALTTAYAPNF